MEEDISLNNDCEDVTLVISDNKPQVINLKGAENASYKITSNSVELRLPSKQSQNASNQMASSKITVNKIVNYDWEHKYYYGNIMSVHKNGDILVYALRNKSEGLVRIIHKRTNERVLLKDFKGQIVDLSFAFCDEIILGCVDGSANAYFYKIYLDSSSKIHTNLCLKIKLHGNNDDDDVTFADTHRLIWCPYIPASETDDDSSKVLAIAYKNEVHILNLDLIIEDYKQFKKVYVDDIQNGHFKVAEHDETILHAAFSPDCQALATASANGEVIVLRNDFKFNETPQILTKWFPHDDKRPISSLIFLDDLTADSSQKIQYWSYILTGCDYNREMKLFSCNNWKLIQKFNFTWEPIDSPPILKAAIDLSASYILISDINRKVFYVMHIFKGQNSFEFGGEPAQIIEISEFSLAYPALNFTIVDRFYAKPPIPISASNESDLMNTELANTKNVVLKVFCIQTKIFQEMLISLKPYDLPNGQSSRLNSSISITDIKDGLSDVLSDREDLNISGSYSIYNGNITQHSIISNNGIQVNTGLIGNSYTPVLMTPDAFSNSPRRLNTTSEQSSSKATNDLIQSIMSAGSSLTNISSHLSVLQPPVLPNLLNPLVFTPVTEIEKSLMMSSGAGGSSQGQRQSKEGSLTPKQQTKNERHLSSSSEDTSTDTNTQSESSIDTNDKEVEDIVQPRDDDKALIEQQEATSVSTLTNEINSNWPNPPLLGQSGPTPSVHRSSNDSGLLAELVNLIKLQQSDIEQLKKQHTSTLALLKDHMDKSKNLPNDDKALILVNQTTSKMEKALKDEIRTNIQAHMSKCIEPFKEQIPHEIAEKLKATESFIKDQISKLFKSKTILDSISQAVSQSIQSAMISSYRDTFQKIVVPSFEKSCQTMFAQINSAFKKGTDDYLQEFNNFSVNQKKLFDEQREPLINQLKSINDNIQNNLSLLSSNLAHTVQVQIDQNIRSSNAILQDTIISSVKAIIKEELTVSMREQQAHLTDRMISFIRQSGAMTPANMGAYIASAPTPTFGNQESKQRMLAYLQKGSYNDAFQTALCAADLSLLVQLCESVSPNQLFETKPCVLQQPVLMSLIQQLSTDLNTHTELKVKYLEEALMNLDQTNALTREHIPQIMPLVVTKLQQFIQSYPNNKITKSVRMLLMACQSFSR